VSKSGTAIAGNNRTLSAVLVAASVTASLVTFATNVVQSLGLPGVCLLIVMSQLAIVPGTEVTMLFAGFSVDSHTHHLSLPGIIIAGVLGDVIGASIAYTIGHYGLVELLSRRGPLHVEQEKIDRTGRWVERFGAPVVAISRLIPVFRSAPPYAAGVVRMGYARFVAMAALGSLVWITGWALVGKAVGHRWPQWKHHLDYVDYAVVVVIVLAVAWWLVKRVRARSALA
jgi:membrane protein DedA with SNARE-associated domain